jgi:hypothetical protein
MAHVWCWKLELTYRAHFPFPDRLQLIMRRNFYSQTYNYIASSQVTSPLRFVLKEHKRNQKHFRKQFVSLRWNIFKIRLYRYTGTSRTLRTLPKTVFGRTYGQNRYEVQFGSELRRSDCISFPPTSESRKAECRNIKENYDAEYSFPNV